jgi:hypothetical protein
MEQLETVELATVSISRRMAIPQNTKSPPLQDKPKTIVTGRVVSHELDLDKG